MLLGLGKINAGTVRNIAPGLAKIEGSIRGKSGGEVIGFLEKIESVLNNIKEETSVDYKITKGAHYPEVIVDENLYYQLQAVLLKDYNFIDCGTKFTAEDFGFFSQKWQSFMIWLGTSKGERYGLHNPKFLPPDEVIKVGKDIYMEIVNNISS